MVPKVVSNIENSKRFDGFHVIDQNIEAFLSLAAQYMTLNRHEHKRCKSVVPGLFVSSTENFIGAGPDAVVKCDCCCRYLVEIQCIYFKPNMHPRTVIDALKGKCFLRGMCNLLSRMTLVQHFQHLSKKISFFFLQLL